MSLPVRVTVTSKPVLMGPRAVPRKTPVLPDKQFKDDRISGLNIYNFEDYVSNKRKALIIFYNSNQPRDLQLETAFVSTVRKRSLVYHSFAAADCFIEETLCKRENINKLPMLKIYSHGFEVNRMEDTNNVTAFKLHQFIENSPVLLKPKDPI